MSEYDINFTSIIQDNLSKGITEVMTCEKLQYNFYQQEIVNAYMLLILALVCIYGSWVFFSFAPSDLIDKHYDTAMYVNKFSGLLILAFIVFQFMYAYNSIFPSIKPQFEILLKIFLVYVMLNIVWKIFWYFKND